MRVLPSRDATVCTKRDFKQLRKINTWHPEWLGADSSQGEVMLIDQSSPMEHLKAFAIVFVAGYLASCAVSLYQKLSTRHG